MTSEQTAAELKKDMAELKTDAAPTSTEEKPTVPKKAAKKTKSAAKKANGHAENQITLKDLAKDYKMHPRIARRRLRLAGLKPEGRWAFEKGSAALKKAEAALAAKAE